VKYSFPLNSEIPHGSLSLICKIGVIAGLFKTTTFTLLLEPFTVKVVVNVPEEAYVIVCGPGEEAVVVLPP
jgi:hypothetical protein